MIYIIQMEANNASDGQMLDVKKVFSIEKYAVNSSNNTIRRNEYGS